MGELCKIRYIVKPKDRIVIGLMTYDPWSEIYENPGERMSYELRDAMVKVLQSYGCNYRIEIKAIAKCSPDDEFDAEYGKKLVEARIWKKYHMRKAMDFEKIMDGISKISKEINMEYARHVKKWMTIDCDLKNYFGKE